MQYLLYLQHYLILYNNLSELEKYELVNSCESITEFVDVLRALGDSDGFIEGKSRKFITEKMIFLATEFYNDTPLINANVVTRKYGLRQQLIYLKSIK